jgi:hypothetical protein
MDKVSKKTRLEYVYDIFKRDYQKAIDRKLYALTKPKDNQTNEKSENKFYRYYDESFADFYRDHYLRADLKLDGDTPIEVLFNFFVDCDPSDNKEYVNWLVNLYRYIVKERISRSAGYNDGFLTPEDIRNFFEDAITKGKEALETFTFLKKTNVLNLENRDINKFRSITEFVNVVKPYMNTDEGDDSVHTLDHKELKCIHNFIDEKAKDGIAELVFENDEWVIVITHDKTANSEFGKYTTWCTAGTRWGNMFDSYHGRGELFVLIKKGYGSKKAVKAHPNYRLQFHFEDDQFMDANDKRININEFLFSNKEIKKFFRSYIVKNVLPKRQNKHRQTDDIKYLLNLGFGDEIIKMFKDSKPDFVDFSGHKIDSEYLGNIGEITSIVKLDLSDCGLTRLPDSIQNLKNLKILKFRNNKTVTIIPEWISKLKNLETLDCAGCNISDIGDVSGNVNLTELVLDFNQNLKRLPKNLGMLSNLMRLTASTCDLREIDDELTNCSQLFLFDIHMNPNLERIPMGISKLPNIEAICIDDTKISMQTCKLMQENSNGKVTIIKYGQ